MKYLLNTYTQIRALMLLTLSLLVMTSYASSGGGNNGFSPTSNPIENTAVLQQIVITPANAITPVGVNVQYTAIGVYSDGSKRDITSMATWDSSNTYVATINNMGLATPVSVGNTTLNATFGGVSATTTLTVTSAQLEQIIITPANATTQVGFNVQYMALGVYSDGASRDITSIVTWASSNSSVATIDPRTGVATPVSVGIAMIKAASSGVSATTTLTVNQGY